MGSQVNFLSGFDQEYLNEVRNENGCRCQASAANPIIINPRPLLQIRRMYQSRAAAKKRAYQQWGKPFVICLVNGQADISFLMDKAILIRAVKTRKPVAYTPRMMISGM